MKIISIFLLQLLMFSCTNKEESSHNISDSLHVSPEQRIESTVSEAENDSLALQKAKVAVPGVKFGISIKEYGDANMYILQGLGANTYFVKPLFNRSAQLYKIEISGLSQKASSFDDKLKEDHVNLINFLERDNGTPSKLAAYPKQNDLKPGKINWTHSWSNHSKQVRVGIAEESLGGTYEVVAWISDQSMIEEEELAAVSNRKQGKRKGR